MAAPLAELPPPAVLRYPFAAPAGHYRAVVAHGASVRRGDVIAVREADDGARPVPIELLHAAASGRIEATPGALMLRPDGEKRRAPALAAPDLVERIREAGIVGLGGAGYPTHLKLRQAIAQGADALIVNAVECEAGVNADRTLLHTHPEDVLCGIEALAGALRAPQVVLALGAPLRVALPIETRVAPGPYPAGWERALTRRLLGRAAPSGGFPTDVGVLVLNVATVFAIARAWRHGEPLTRRVVTVGTAEHWVRIGHPVAELPLPAGTHTVGGPVTGWPAAADAAVRKDTRSVTPRPAVAESPCIRCGWCAPACPQGLLPQELLRGVEAKRWEQVERLRLDECIECGACDLACPSRLPLLAAFRHAKRQRREAAERAHAADLARQRFDQRNVRNAQRRDAARLRRDARLEAPHAWVPERGAQPPHTEAGRADTPDEPPPTTP